MSQSGQTLSQYALVNGARLYYVDEGRGPPLLMVHGLGASHSDWEHQVGAFSRVFRVVAPDLRGHGDSDAFGPFSVERFATDLLQLAEQLGIGNFALMGHSMGGAVAMQMAILRPERVVKLVLTNTLPNFRPQGFLQRRQIWYRQAMVRLFGMRRLAQATARRMFPEPAQAAQREALARRNARIDPKVYLETLRAATGWAVQDKLQWLRMPTLVMAAEHDYFPVAAAQAFAEALPDSHYRVFEGAHHGLPMECPEEFNRAVMEFLMPSGGAAAVRGDGGLNWLRVDTRAMPKIDVRELLKKN